MKRISSLLLGLPLVFAVGCGSDEPAPKPVRSFSAAYEPGLFVALEGSISGGSKNFVELNGVVTQVDGLDDKATTDGNSGVCRTRQDNKKTETVMDGTGSMTTRVVGKTKAWLLPDSYKRANPDSTVNIWGNPAKGDLYLVQPSLDVFTGTQLFDKNPRPLEQYLSLYEIELALFEETMASTLNSKAVITDNINTEENHTADYKHDNGVWARYKAEGFVWETRDVVQRSDSYSNGPIKIKSHMVLPDNVRVGDTWIDDEDGTINGAVAIEKVNVGGKDYDALHVVTRGTTQSNVVKKGVVTSCLTFPTVESVDEPASKELGVLLTGKCSDESAGWTNEIHIWYYKGVPIKIEGEETFVELESYGYAAGHNNDIPSGRNAGGNNPGDCALWDAEADPNITATGTPDQLARLQPYAIYSVSSMKISLSATEISSNFTLAQEHKEGQ